MNKNTFSAITISRQTGSGGTYIGFLAAKKLGFRYLDREILQQAAKELGVPYEINKVTDLKQIMALQVMVTPALVVDGSLKVAGRVPSVEEIKKLLV